MINKKSYKTYLSDIMEADYLNEYEIVGDFAIALSLCVINSMEVYVYGAGTDSFSFVKFLRMQGIKVKNVLDIDDRKNGKTLDGVKIIHPKELKNVVTDAENTFIFIHTSFFTGMRQHDIIKYFTCAGVIQFYPLTKYDRYLATANTSYWVDCNRELYYKEHLNDLYKTINLLSDEKSCQVMCEYIRTYMQKDVYRLEQLPCRYKYFYDYDVKQKECKEIYHHNKNEVWINCGAHEGDNIFYFYAAGLHAKDVLAVEGDHKIVSTLRENMNRLPERLFNQVRVEDMFIDKNTNFDELLRGEKLTLLNADIEGAELGLLEACKDVIKKDRPVITICVYHKKEDLIELPQYINKIVDDYKFYIRKYAAHYGNENRNKELVMYAVPKERAID